MTTGTHNLDHYASVIGRCVNFMARPQKTRQKKYREPLLVKRKRFQTKREAEIAAAQWEGRLI